MATSSGNSSGMSKSGSEHDLQIVKDQRKRKRMESNRESARRSRMRKQKHLDDLTIQVTNLKTENNQIIANINVVSQNLMNAEAENSILRAQMLELSQRLQSLDEILNYMNSMDDLCDEIQDVGPNYGDNFINPLNMVYYNHPIMASADMFG